MQGPVPDRPSRTPRPADGRWDLALVCVAGYILFAVGRTHQLFPALLAFRPVLVAGSLAILLYVFDQNSARRLRQIWSPPVLFVLAILAWAALSLPGAIWRRDGFDFLSDIFIKTVTMFFIIVGTVRGRRDVERLAAVFVAAAVIYALVLLTRYEVSATQWRLQRTGLYYYDANDFSAFAITALPLALYFAVRAKRLAARAAAAGSIAALTMAFVWAGSRGGFLALAALVLFLVVRYRAVALRWRLLGVAAIAAVVLFTASDRYWEQMRTIGSSIDYNRTSETGRMEIWQRGVGYMLDRPFFGVGIDNFAAAECTLSPLAERMARGIGVACTAPHNSFIQIGAELGVPGLILFVLLLGSVLRRMLRLEAATRHRAKKQARTPALAQALAASLFAFIVGGFFLSLAYYEFLYALLALSLGLEKVTRHAASPLKMTEPVRPARPAADLVPSTH